MESKVYNQSGEVVGTVKLPEAIFGLPWNADLVHQVTVAMKEKRRLGLAQSKGRGEVRGGGKKPWRQKGTGRARHGSIRSPLWRGGGVTHGPLNSRVYDQKINRKMRNLALCNALSAKYRDGEIIFLDNLKIDSPKTKSAVKTLKNLSVAMSAPTLAYRTGRRALVAPLQASEAMLKSFRNLKPVTVEELRNLNPLEVLTYRYLILINPEESVDVLSQRLVPGKIVK